MVAPQVHNDTRADSRGGSGSVSISWLVIRNRTRPPGLLQADGIGP
jgi:hypothetical protein